MPSSNQAFRQVGIARDEQNDVGVCLDFFVCDAIVRNLFSRGRGARHGQGLGVVWRRDFETHCWYVWTCACGVVSQLFATTCRFCFVLFLFCFA